MLGETRRNSGVLAKGIWTPLIREGDDLASIVVSEVLEQIGRQKVKERAVIGVTEAVVAYSQGNYVSKETIAKDIANKFAGAKSLAIVDPIQSRNRFFQVLEAIVSTPELEKVYVVLSYPTDEVGNRLVSDAKIRESGINPYIRMFTAEEFYQVLGVPEHPFTGQNYIDLYTKCNEKIEVVLCNDFSQVPEICKDVLICSIHRRSETRAVIEAAGAERVLDLSQIMDKPIDGSGYNPDFGVYGSNARADGTLKLMPINCQEFVEDVQKRILDETGKLVEVMVYGDGAFKDPIGQIWELADPTTTLAYTKGLEGTPKEVKLKYFVSKYPDKSKEEIEEIIAAEKAKRLKSDNIAGEASLGTTPRRKIDLLASMFDLISGSGDRQTPVVYCERYL